MLLHEEHVRARRVHRDAMDAMAYLSVLIGHRVGVQSTVRGAPRIAGVVGPEDTGGRYGDEHPVGVRRIHDDGVQAQTARARRPARCRLMGTEGRQLAPALATVGRLEKRGVLDARVYRVGVALRRFQVPDALELPGMRGAVVPGVRARRALIGELVADGLPGLAAIVRALQDLAEPTAGLGGIQPVGVSRRSLEVIDLPAREMGALDLPLLPCRIRAQNERAFPSADQYPYLAHTPYSSLPGNAASIQPFRLTLASKLIGCLQFSSLTRPRAGPPQNRSGSFRGEAARGAPASTLSAGPTVARTSSNRPHTPSAGGVASAQSWMRLPARSI